MTSLVAIRCTDGVVVGADSSATFGPHPQVKTIEQTYDHKIAIIGGHIIVAGTGQVGHGQRFNAVVQRAWDQKKLSGKSEIEIMKILAADGLQDFASTFVQANNIGYSALVAYPASDRAALCEIVGANGFQPELKEENGLWFTSAGSGQMITDPFLALLRQVFWKDAAPNLQGGIFTTLWALQHACDVNPGGIKEPISIAVLERDKGKYHARMLEKAELEEHGNMVAAGRDHFAGFRDILLGKGQATNVPPLPQPKVDGA